MKNSIRIVFGTAFLVLFSMACGRYGDLPWEEDAVCGNGMVESPELCDDGNAEPGDGCSETCRIEAGWACDGEEPCHCIPFIVCGNGVLEAPESCDDHNTEPGDGCSAACQVEFGWTCDEQAPSVCSPTIGCGNGVREDPELCDDGYFDDCGTCNADCTGPGNGAACGDGQICPETELCDDGYVDACGTCNANCTGPGSGAACGDGLTCPETELCDDGYLDACGTCNADCSGPGSGSACGDGQICPEIEHCDDGYLDACGTCNADCSGPGAGSTCGDGAICYEFEFCDDGINDGGEGTCVAGCSAIQICGDGKTEGTEACDDGINGGGEGLCVAGCLAVQICGNGTSEGSEFCDDGGLDPCGDCNLDCSGAGSGSTCTISSVASGAWDDPAVWDWNRVPISTDDVVISPGDEVTFSGNSEDSASQDLEVQSGGILILRAGSDVNMVVDGDIRVAGTLEMQDSPGHTSTLEVQNSVTGEHGVIVSNGGTFSANCAPPVLPTLLSSGYAAGERIVTVTDASGLSPGERITIGADDQAEGFFVESINGQEITLDRYADNSQAAGALVYKLYSVLTAPSAANTLTVANAQGIEIGDVLAVGPTSTSAYDVEFDLLVTGVSGNEITLDGALDDAHAAGAEVIKTNRRCRLRAADSDYRTYVLVEDGGVLDLDYVEVSHIGHDLIDQEGITINTSVVSTPLNGCSVHTAYKPIVFYLGTNTTLTSNAVFDYTVGGIMFEEGASDYNNVLANVVFYLGSSVWGRGGDHLNISYNTIFSNGRALQLYPGSDDCVMHANIVHSSGKGVHICTSIQNTAITYNRLFWNEFGVFLHWSCSDNLIANNVVYSNDYGIYLNPESDQLNHVLNNTCDNNDYGLYATDLSTGAIVRNNIFSNSLISGIEAVGTASMTNTYNNVWSSTGADYVDNVTAGTGDISVDPLFVSSTDRRYLLQSMGGFYPFGAGDLSGADSPCLDAGDPADDYSLEPVSGGRINLGAYGNSSYASKPCSMAKN